uniref:RNA-dependent RNA polymerase n=1 Tax=Acer yangbiense TaxID=1000413 RepID=A0A5C7GQ78_9ROSI
MMIFILGLCFQSVDWGLRRKVLERSFVPSLKMGVMVESLFTLTVAFSWVFSGLGVNVFVAPASLNGPNKYVRFSTGQPLGYLSSWPLFALAHHFVVWYCAEQVYPGMRFRNYALLGDDIVIGDARVADVYKDVIQRLGVKISLPKYLVSDIGGLEFAKKFRILDRDLSSISVKMIRSARHSIAWMPVLKQFYFTSLQISLRIRGADFRRYSMKP